MAKDKFHEQVKQALQSDGWLITHDPFKIMLGRRRGYIDLGATREIIAAERENEKIAVEIKSFIGHSDLDDFEDALGQFMIYWKALKKKEPDRVLFLAMPTGFYKRFFDDPFFVELAEDFDVKMLLYDELNAKIERWIK